MLHLQTIWGSKEMRIRVKVAELRLEETRGCSGGGGEATWFHHLCVLLFLVSPHLCFGEGLLAEGTDPNVPTAVNLMDGKVGQRNIFSTVRGTRTGHVAMPNFFFFFQRVLGQTESLAKSSHSFF